MNEAPAEDEPPSNGPSSVVLIGAGIAVFIVCSIVQSAGDSNMFTTSFEDPGNAFLALLMQLTWWPSWIATVLLIGAGVVGMLNKADGTE